MNHGHVRPNPDGSVARCGGPPLCEECAIELVNVYWEEHKAYLIHNFGERGDMAGDGSFSEPAKTRAHQYALTRIYLIGVLPKGGKVRV